MKKKIKLGSKILVVLAACLSMFGVAHAAESASTEVQITIEGQNIVTPEEKPKAEGPKNIPTQLVQTGDGRNIWSYVLGALGAVALGAVAFWSRKRNKVFLMLMAVTLSAMFFHNTSLAAEGVGTGTATTGQVANVSVTVPTKVSVCFEEDGTTSVSSFAIRNQSLAPLSTFSATSFSFPSGTSISNVFSPGFMSFSPI
jgi:LPXTG-motif cell wall-anchored protein